MPCHTKVMVPVMTAPMVAKPAKNSVLVTLKVGPPLTVEKDVAHSGNTRAFRAVDGGVCVCACEA